MEMEICKQQSEIEMSHRGVETKN